MIHKASMILASLIVWALSPPAVRADEVATDDNLQLTLPSSIYAVPELETSIYFDNLILTSTPELYEFRVTCDVGETDGVRWFVTPQDSQSGRHSFEISVSRKDGQLIDRKTATLYVTPKEERPPRNDPLKLLIIGDSLTHATAYPNEVARLLSLPHNPEWTMLGTHKPAAAAPGVAHEGYGGWTWERFVNKYEPNPDGTYRKRSSPFVFLGDDDQPQLDVARYLDDRCGGQRPDYVVIMLGINDCFSAPPDDPKGIDARISSMFAYADRLLTAIQQSAPAAQIGLCLTTPPNSRQAAFEANYQDRYTRWGWKRIQHRLVQRQLEYVSAKNDRRISVIPTELNLDPVGGYPENNGVHPNTVGYKQIGATIFSWLKWQIASAEKKPLPAAPENNDVFLLPCFPGNGASGIYFSHSYDGYRFQWLNAGDVVMPAPSREEGTHS